MASRPRRALPPEPLAATRAIDVADLVRRHQAGLWRFLRALGCDARSAEEVTQDTFVAVLQRPFAAIDDPSTAAYLRTVAKRLLWKTRRRDGRPAPMPPDVLEALESAFVALGGDHADGGDAAIDALRGCVAGLDARAKALVDAHYKDGVSRVELGRRFEMSEDGIKSWMRRVRAQLRACVERKVQR